MRRGSQYLLIKGKDGHYWTIDDSGFIEVWVNCRP